MINRKLLSTTFIYFSISLCLYWSFFLVSHGGYFESIHYIGVMTIIQIIMNILAYNASKIRFFGLASLFTWLNYVFHLAQPIVKVIAPDYQLNFDVSQYVSESVFIQGLTYSWLTMIFLTTGILLANSFTRRKINPSTSLTPLQVAVKERNLLKIGGVIFVLTFPFEFYLQISRLFVALDSGYLATFNFELGGFFGVISNLSIVGFIVILLGLRSKPRLGTIFVAIYTAFYLIAMFSGGRMWQITKLLLVISFYFQIYNFRFNYKNTLLLLLIAYFGSGFMSVIANIRSYDFSNSSYILQMFIDIFQENPILDVLDEFGGTIYTLDLTIEKVPTVLKHSWGSQFLTNFVSLLPNITGKVDQMVNDANYVLLLKTPSIGGSFIGEMYYSFGNFGVVITFIIGILTQTMTEKIQYGLNNYRYNFIIYTIMFQYSFISWVRGSSSILYRNTFYGMIIILIITSMLYYKTRPVRQLKKI